MASFVQLPSGNWRVQVRRKNRYVAETFRRRKDGEEWALDIERNIDRSGSPKPRAAFRVRTFGDLIDLHVDDMKEVGRPPRRSKAAVLEALKETLGTVKLTHLNRERLTHGLQSLKLIHPADHHDPDLYGAVTIEGVSRLEVDATRWKIFCMAITATDSLDRGRQSPKSRIFVKEGYGDVAMRTARRSSEIYTLIFD